MAVISLALCSNQLHFYNPIWYNGRMARKWTSSEEYEKFDELYRLYVTENHTLAEISNILGIAQSTAFQRMVRLGIPSTPDKKETYIARRRTDICIPKQYTSELAEFWGIMLGDGKLSYYQVVVTLGTKELSYAEYVVDLMQRLFGAQPKIGFRKTGFKDVYIGSVDLTEWLRKGGLVYNKVLSQVDAPHWIFRQEEYIQRFLRGFFDTDGSIYKLRFGVQISFNNKSKPLLKSVHRMLWVLGYRTSKINGFKIYLTKRNDVIRFFSEVRPANPKHQARFKQFLNQLRVGRPVGGGGRL